MLFTDTVAKCGRKVHTDESFFAEKAKNRPCTGKGGQGVEKVAKPLFRGKLMNVFLREIAFHYGKRPARPAKPVDTMRVLQTANDCC